MRTIARRARLAVLLIAVIASGGALRAHAEPSTLLGACYCRAAGSLSCTSELSEVDCRRRCDEALCDDWFWKERLPCWNWGYGG
jgi:hypothetical protein